jgi:hypothetical protein
MHKCFVVRSLCHVIESNTSDVAGSLYVRIGPAFIQSVPGVKFTTSGFNSRADSESKSPHPHMGPIGSGSGAISF